MVFLGLYARCASYTLNAGKARYAMTPKHHMLAHDAYDLVLHEFKSNMGPKPTESDESSPRRLYWSSS